MRACPPPPAVGPRWLRRAIARGLSPEPASRFPSMGALLAELEVKPRRRRRALAGAVVAAGALALTILAYRELTPGADRRCRVASRGLATLRSPSERARGRARYRAAPAARADYDALDRRLDGWARDWAAARVGACEDAGATDTRAQALFAQRLSCLDAQLEQARALTEELSRPPLDDVGAGLSAFARRLDQLAAPSTCMRSATP
jgi:hypothetical protein